jgi:hypothetical protein
MLLLFFLLPKAQATPSSVAAAAAGASSILAPVLTFLVSTIPMLVQSSPNNSLSTLSHGATKAGQVWR